jgi:tyrosine-protein kinase Etk/Wzc
VKGEAYTLYVGKSSLYNAVNSCSSNLSVSLNSEKASVIDLSFKDNSTQRAEDVLSMLISVYNENWVKDKNQIAVSTSMFINERLGVIERELGNVDEDISSYKSEHLLPDVQAASSMYMAQSSAANAQILALNNQLYMTRYIRNYLANDANRTQLLPANSGIESANIESQIAEYNKQLLQRNSLVANSSAENPLVVDMDQALASMRGSDNQVYRQSDSNLEFADKKFAADGATDDITYSGQPYTGQIPAVGGAPAEGKGGSLPVPVAEA